jgi:hypothetical protein
MGLPIIPNPMNPIVFNMQRLLAKKSILAHAALAAQGGNSSSVWNEFVSATFWSNSHLERGGKGNATPLWISAAIWEGRCRTSIGDASQSSHHRCALPAHSK